MKTAFFLIILCGHVRASVDTAGHNVTYDHHDSSHHGNNSKDHDDNHTAHKEAHDGHEEHGIHLISIHYDYVSTPLLIAVFLFSAGICKLGFHHADFLSSRVPESCLLIILGIIVGAILRYSIKDNGKAPGMNSELFFLYLLPPIILESAWSLHDRTFFDNVGTILIYAVIGTVLNCFLIGPTLYGLASSGAMGNINIEMIQCLVFSAIIVAVDPVAVLAIFQEIGVNNVLYFLVFGESLLNDAVTVVLYNMMKTFNSMTVIPVEQVFLGFVKFFVVSFGGIIVGLIHGMLTAIITKYTEHVRVIEPLSVFILAYMSYLVAELFHFSGIISIIACGLTQAQYAFRNISQKSHTTVKYFSKMQSSISDCIIFVFLGIALFKKGMFQPKNWHVGFIIWTLVLCLLYRFIVVFLLTYFVNRSNRVRRIGKEEQFIMAYGGIRGAVAFSLMDLLEGDNIPKEMFTTTLMVLIFFTVFVQGISIKPLVKLLRIKLQSTDKATISEEINSHVTDHVMAGIEEVLGRRGEHHFREILEFYNSKYLKNWLQKNPTSVDEHIMSLYEKIALQQHFESLAGSKMVQEKYISDDDLATPLIPDEVRNQIIQEESEEDVEDEESDDDEKLLPAITVPPPIPMPPADAATPSPLASPLPSPGVLPLVQPDMIDDWLDRKLEEQRKEDRKAWEKTGRRKSLFPQFRKKEPESTEPTVKDIRKLMVPSRRDLVHRKLDKNLKNDSSADLLKYLQEKQLRTRRMSRAVLGGGTSTPKSSQHNINFTPRRCSIIAANQAAQNYKRRLSLAVPERPRFKKDRSPSDFTGISPDANLFRGIGDAARNGESSPRRKKRLFKKAHTLNFEPELSPMVYQNSMGGRSPRLSGKSFDVIHEHDEKEDSCKEGEDLDTSRSSAGSDASRKRRFRFRKAKSFSDEDNKSPTSSIRKQITDPTSESTERSPTKVKFAVKSEILPKKRKKKAMQKSKSFEHSRSSGEFSDDTGPISGAESHSSLKSDSLKLGSSPTKSDLGSSPTRTDSELEKLDVNNESEHAGRKASYTQAMSNVIPEDSNTSVELKDFKKGGQKSLKKQDSV